MRCPGLHPLVGVTDQAGCRLPLADGHVQGIQDQLGAEVVGHRSAHNSPGEGVQDHRQVQPPFAGALLGAFGHPQLIGLAAESGARPGPVRGWRSGGGVWSHAVSGDARLGGRARASAGRPVCG